MKTEFSDHAIEQQKIRKISKKRITETVKHPDETEESFRGRLLRRKWYGDKILEVVIVPEEGKIIIVTEYYLENI